MNTNHNWTQNINLTKKNSTNIIFQFTYTFFVFFLFVSFKVSAQGGDLTLSIDGLYDIKQRITQSTNGLAGFNSNFGTSVDVDGNYAVIGSPKTMTNGVAYIFSFDGTNWTEISVLQPNSDNNSYSFGKVVNILGDRILVSSDGLDSNNINTGLVYVYEKSLNGEWLNTKILSPLNGLANDNFGSSIVQYGNSVIVGSDVSDGLNPSSVYIYDVVNGLFTLSQRLIASDGTNGDHFGCSVDISGDFMVVGSKTDGNSNSGAAYIFQFDGFQWVELVKLLADNSQAVDNFGTKVSIQNDSVIVTAPNSNFDYIFHNQNGTWVLEQKLTKTNGQTVLVKIDNNHIYTGVDFAENTSGIFSGAIYDYEKINNLWTNTGIIFSSDGKHNDKFGFSFAIRNNSMIVGAPFNSDLGNSTGAAYIFNNSLNGNWSEVNKVLPKKGSVSDFLGESISVYGNYLLLGVREGAAYIFEFIAGEWVEKSKLVSSDGTIASSFGNSVSLYGTTAVVGSPHTYDGNNYGAVYIFEFISGQWQETNKLTAVGGDFGDAVSIYNDSIIIGAPLEDSQHGAIYFYKKVLGQWVFDKRVDASPTNTRHFGRAVSLHEDLAIVGSTKFTTPSSASIGTAFLYHRNIESWNFAQELVYSGLTRHSDFGYSVDLSSDRIIIGDPSHFEGGGTIISVPGSAYIFKYSNSIWQFHTKLTPDVNTYAGEFGKDVRLIDNLSLIGSNAIPAIYLFKESNNQWNQELKISSTSPFNSDRFGNAIGLSQKYIVAGAPRADYKGTNSGLGYALIKRHIFSDSFE